MSQSLLKAKKRASEKFSAGHAAGLRPATVEVPIGTDDSPASLIDEAFAQIPGFGVPGNINQRS